MRACGRFFPRLVVVRQFANEAKFAGRELVCFVSQADELQQPRHRRPARVLLPRTFGPFPLRTEPPGAVGTLAAVGFVSVRSGSLEVGRASADSSHGRGRVDPAAADGHYWELGIPNGTGGISSIFKAHLGAERGGAGRTASPGRERRNADCLHGGNWDVIEGGKKGDSSEELVHARQLVPAGEECLLLPHDCCGSGTSSDCRANTTEAPAHVPIVLPATTICRAAIGSRK